MKVLLTLTDVEPAVRLNGMLERAGYETALVSPIDDVRAAIRRESPDLVVLTGGLVDSANVQLVRDLLWDGVAAVGLADIVDPALHDRLRAIGFVEVYAKPVDLDEVLAGIRRILDRRRLAIETGLIGESEAMREVLVKIEQMAPVSSTVLIEGESGTGKELVARAMHRLSPRQKQAVHRGEHRRAAGDAARERAVRPREGIVHRRGGAKARAVRAGEHGNALSRRDRRGAAGARR